MMKFKNTEYFEGYVYEQKLSLVQIKKTDSQYFGQSFIKGTVSIATDEDGLNVIPVTYSFVMPTRKDGSPNETYNVLSRILNENCTWTAVGKENALKVRVSTSIGVNDFYNKEDKLISAMINDNGFISVVSDFSENRNSFKTDMLIVNVSETEDIVDENTGDITNPSHVIIKGAVFNFRNELIPVSFIVRDAGGCDYFLSLGASDSNPILTQVAGYVNSQQIVSTRTQENAFGPAKVISSTRSVREWTVDWAKPEVYDFGSEDVLTIKDVNDMTAARELKLAEDKRKSDEYKKSRAGGNALTQSTNNSNSIPVSVGNFVY